jgi:hypothetical protein
MLGTSLTGLVLRLLVVAFTLYAPWYIVFNIERPSSLDITTLKDPSVAQPGDQVILTSEDIYIPNRGTVEDKEFGVRFSNSVTGAHRTVKYCQWDTMVYVAIEEDSDGKFKGLTILPFLFTEWSQTKSSSWSWLTLFYNSPYTPAHSTYLHPNTINLGGYSVDLVQHPSDPRGWSKQWYDPLLDNIKLEKYASFQKTTAGFSRTNNGFYFTHPPRGLLLRMVQGLFTLFGYMVSCNPGDISVSYSIVTLEFFGPITVIGTLGTQPKSIVDAFVYHTPIELWDIEAFILWNILRFVGLLLLLAVSNVETGPYIANWMTGTILLYVLWGCVYYFSGTYDMFFVLLLACLPLIFFYVGTSPRVKTYKKINKNFVIIF